MAGLTTLVNPFSGSGPDLSISAPDMSGMQNVAASGAMFPDMSGLLPTIEAPQAPARAAPQVQYNAATSEYAVGGQRFATDDATKILQSEQALSQPATPADLGPGWQPITTASYQQVIEGIKNPSLSRLAAKNFGRGVDVNQMLAGRFLQFAGAEDLGKSIAKTQIEELGKTAPYERSFTEDVASPEGKGILQWFVGNLAQQGPNLIESAVTAIAGGIAGGAAGGGPNPVTAAGGAILGLVGKQSVKQATLAAAKKYGAGEALTTAESRLLFEMAGITAAAQIRQGTLYAGREGLLTAGQFAAQEARRAVGTGAAKAGLLGLNQARVGGAAIATGLQNYATGIADVYGETIESGDPDRATAAALGIPYAIFETLPEFLLAGRIFGNLGAKAITATSALGKAGAYAGRAAKGFAIGGLSEGSVEAGQEGLLLGANEDVDWDSPEGVNRLVNSFAAGFGVGGPIGAVANLRNNQPANLLQPAMSPEPTDAETVLTGELVDDSQRALPAPPPATSGLALPPPPNRLPPPPDVTFSGSPGPQLPPGAIPLGGPIAPAYQQQGVLDLFSDATQGELAQRAQPVSAPIELYGPQATPVANPAQGALQFAPPAPSGVGFTDRQLPTAFGQQLLDAQQPLIRARDYPLAQAQQEAQQTQQLAQDYPLAQQQQIQQQIQQQLQLVPASEMGGYDAAGSTGLLPTVEARPTQATQLLLPLEVSGQRIFDQPRPTRAEKLKQGPRPAALTPEVVPATQKELEAAGQLRLFNEKGRPTINALRGAARKLLRGKPEAEAGTTQISPTGKKVDLTVAARKRAKEAKREAQADVKKDVTLVSERRVKDATDTPIVELTLSDGSVRRIQRAVGSQTREGFTGWYDVDLLENPKPYQVAYIADTKQGAINRILADTNAAPTQGTPNAVQEQGTDEVSARNEPGTGKRVGPEVRRTGKPAREGKLRRKGQEVITEPVPEGQVAGQEEALNKAEAERKQRTDDAIALAEANAQAAFDFRAEYESLTDAIDSYRQNLVDTLSKTDQYITADALAAYDAYVSKNRPKRKKVTPTKKSEAALAAATEVLPSAKGVTIRVRVGKGTIPANADEVLAKVDSDIDRYSALLDCLRK